MYALVAMCISAFYSLCSLLPKQEKIVFLSRQGRQQSLDFSMLAERIEQQCPGVKVRVCATDPENVDKTAFVRSLPAMIYHAATSRVCVLEGYIPAVSIPKLREGTCVIQLWHALGAIKKFGFQSVGTASGRSADAAQALGMHRNYDWIIAAGPGAVPAYSEAFGYDESRVKVLGMPRMDYLLESSEDSLRSRKMEDLREKFDFLSGSKMKVLYAPTLRQGRREWMASEVEKLAQAFRDRDCVLIVAGHPLEANRVEAVAESNVRYVPGAKSIDLLGLSDMVITDYSAIAFEASLVGKAVWFYVPDIDEYRESPGLNIDPKAEFPNEAFSDANVLVEAIIACDQSTKCGATSGSFADYTRRYFADIAEGSTRRLADFVQECYLNTFKPLKGNRNASVIDKGETTC